MNNTQNKLPWAGVETVAVIGECMLELSSSHSGTLGAKYLGFGGDTLNTAVYLAGAGQSVDYFTALGDDVHSDAMITRWRSAGIGCDSVVRAAGRLPGLYMIETDTSGERSFYYWRDNSPARELFDDAEQASALFSPLQSFGLIYLSGITLSLYSDAALTRLLEFLTAYRQGGGLVAFDSNYRLRLWPDRARAVSVYNRFYQQVDIALLTLEDEESLFGLEGVEQLQEMFLDFPVSELLIKQGEAGCFFVLEGELLNVPALSVEQVVDTTGAGDSFNAGYLAGRMRGETMLVSVQRGHRYGAQVVQQQGAIVHLNYD